MDTQFSDRLAASPERSKRLHGRRSAQQSPRESPRRLSLTSPSTSPSRRVRADDESRTRPLGVVDRFLPTVQSDIATSPPRIRPRATSPNGQGSDRMSSQTVTTRHALLRNELLGHQVTSPTAIARAAQASRQREQAHAASGLGSASETESHVVQESVPGTVTSVLRYKPVAPKPVPLATNLSPVSSASQKLLAAPHHQARQIPNTPYKILDAPDLIDDFYLNLLDWSSTNTLAVALDTCVYLWSARTSAVTKLCDVAEPRTVPKVTSLRWALDGKQLAVGLGDGTLGLWDPVKTSLVRSYAAHPSRIGCLAWNPTLVAAGSRDNKITVHDPRDRAACAYTIEGHSQEVCGIQWAPNGTHLASGGNDNRLFVWHPSASTDRPLHSFSHAAAIKAIAWSPHQHGLLASGGGTADKSIRFWNTLSGQMVHLVNTGSQVCNLAWSPHSKELVSTHGFSHNQVIVWSYPAMTQLAVLTAHTARVLYLAVSPDGKSICTGAGDETLRFWTVFKKGNTRKTTHAVLAPMSQLR
eukprot:m.22195 g.22195  ORF g.22195 m.22195 type:complete len:527 (-) comp8364_c1_seq3:25-1605(-)